MPDDENVRPSVLIIEGAPSISEIVASVLDKEGFITHAAFDGAQGLDAYYLTQPVTIMLDVKMPVMDGWETLTRLRRVSETSVIMLAVYSAKQDIIKGLEIGVDEYLVKPFGIKEFVSHVTTVLRRTPMVFQLSAVMYQPFGLNRPVIHDCSS